MQVEVEDKEPYLEKFVAKVVTAKKKEPSPKIQQKNKEHKSNSLSSIRSNESNNEQSNFPAVAIQPEDPQTNRNLLRENLRA